MKLYCGVPRSRRRIGHVCVFRSESITGSAALDYMQAYRTLRRQGVPAHVVRSVLTATFLAGVAAEAAA